MKYGLDSMSKSGKKGAFTEKEVIMQTLQKLKNVTITKQCTVQ